MARSIVRLLAVAAATSISVGAIMCRGEWSAMPIYTAISLLYGVAIGVPAMLIFRRLRPRLFGRPQLRQWLTYAGVLLGLIVIATFAVRSLLVAVGVLTVDQMWGGMITSFEISLGIAVPCTLGAVSFSRMQKELHEVEASANEARIASLESRIRPHFLFNALNSAIALIPEDPARAENVLERLSGLLRFSLDAHSRLVPLREELRVVVDYLEIERVRFGERLAYELDVPAACETFDVPAFAVQTLVENSVKHAVSPRKQGARIRVRARAESGRLALDVTDDGPGFTGEIWRPGHGLDALRSRLEALYGAAAQLRVQATTVTIDVPTSPAARG
jgi:hypothetical protein